MDTKRLAGKNILITGAAQGMGAANAVHFAAQGANICLGDLDVDLAQNVADEINASGNGKAITHNPRTRWRKARMQPTINNQKGNY